jgi:diguanylate cyclase (GGDEF)-like protein
LILLGAATQFTFAQSIMAPGAGIEYCQIAQVQEGAEADYIDLEKDEPLSFALNKGINELTIKCQLTHQSVLNFERYELIDIQWEKAGAPLETLKATSPTFLLPSGELTVRFTLLMHNRDITIVSWTSVEEFFNKSLVNNIVMGAFYGLCIVLILYVWFMGRILGDQLLTLYSLYVFCASTFFLLQEGQLHIFLPQQFFILGHFFYILFAGLTVVAATVFITRVTEINSTWPKLTHYVLNPAALIVLLLSVFIALGEHNLASSVAGIIMAYLTLLIMVSILILVIWQTIRKVEMAWLVCFSLITMVAAMAMRILPIDVGDFMTRYGLIMAFALEAFIFAIVVSSRIESIKIAKQRAEAQANTDVLCNILNRRGWVTKTEELLSMQRKSGGLLSIFYIDLDNFKAINDTHGHDCGDKVLSIIAKILANQSRTNDVVGRVGGDEFVVAGLFDLDYEAEGIAIRLTERLSNLPLQINDELSITVCASVGHVMFETPQESVNHMLSQADKSMYKKKRGNLTVDGFPLVT